jgi:hypothetical protein
MNLGKYEILSELGHGAMGVVYRARDPVINRLVAIKTITTGFADDSHLRQRFYREAQSAGSLQHPNIVTIHDMGEQDRIPYIAMELIDGESLDSLVLRLAPIPISLKVAYATQACRAFNYAHKRGIVHRDIKPANIMLTKEGIVKVVDFGIARVVETSKTKTGMLIGTFAYMSPEQYDGEHADERSDIWSFGVLLYELLSYQKPFIGDTPAKLMRSISDHDPKPLAELVPGCPTQIADIVSKCLQKSPAERFQSMQDVLLDLEPVCKGLQEQAVAELTDQCRRHVERNEFSEARDLLRHALQIEPENQRVRAMFESVSTELKRILARPKALQFVEKGRALLQEGKAFDAKAAAENALHLDSSFEPARELQRAVRVEMDRAQLVKGWVEAAKQHLAEGLPEEAETLLIRAMQTEPENKQAAALQEQAAKEKVERQNRLRLLEKLQQARDLWTRQEYRQSIRLLVDLETEFPGGEEIPRLLETVRDDQVDQRRHLLVDAQNLLEACHFQECFSLLAKMEEQFPNDDEINALTESGHRAQTEYRRHQELTDAKGLIISCEYDRAISALSTLQKDFPDDTQIPRLLEDARDQQTERRKQQSISRARELVAGRRYAESADLLMNMRKEFPNDTQILKLLDAVGADQAVQRKRDGLAEARRLIASRFCDEAISALTELRADFPEEPAIAKLLDTARSDKADQQKQQKLIEARAHLAARSFGEALTLLDALAVAHPNDPGILKLRALAQHERDKHAREERIQRELESLKKLMNERNYLGVISKSRDLLTEFPDESNVRRLAEFAASQQESIDNEDFVQNVLKEATALFNGRRYKECRTAAQNGLRVAPSNTDLLRLQSDAEIQEKKRTVHDQIEERVRQIRFKINREEFSGAISLARETIKTYGADTDVSQLLSSAQIEWEAREQKNTGSAVENTRELHDEEQVIPAPNRPTATSSGLPAATSEYAFFQNAPGVPDAPPTDPLRGPTTSQGAATKRTIAPRPFGGESVEQIPSSPDVVPPVQLQASESAEPGEDQYLVVPRLPEANRLALRSNQRKFAVVSILVLGAGAAVLIAMRSRLTAELSRSKENKTEIGTPIIPQQTAELEARQRAALSAASDLIATNDLTGARDRLRSAAALNGPLTEELTKRVADIDTSKDDPQLRQLRQREELLWRKALKSADGGRYIEAQKELRQILQLGPGGLHRDDAQMYLNKVIPQHLQEMDLLTQARFDLAQDEFQSARAIAAQLTKNGSDPSKLVAEIDERERVRIAQLEKRFNDLSTRDDDQVVFELNSLWPKFQELAASGGPVSGEALDYVNKIPETVVSLQTRMKQNDADALFERTIRAYQQSVKLSDKNGLKLARTNFESIARANGPHGQDAKSYLGEVNQKLAEWGEAPISSSSSSAKAGENAVRATMQLYLHAFEQRDVDALRQVWPSIGSQYEGFKLWFENAKSIRVQLQIESIKFDADGTTAAVKAHLTREYVGTDSKVMRLNEAEGFQLSRLNGTWVITDVDATF